MRAIFNRRFLSRKNKKRPTYSENQPQVERLKVLSQWLLVIPVVMLILFSCGQLGILTSRKIAEANTQTQMSADYGPWSYVLIHSINPEIINEIIRDKPLEEGVSGLIPATSERDATWIESTPGKDLAPSNTPPNQSSTPAGTQQPPSTTPTSTNPSPTEKSDIPPTSTPTPTDAQIATPSPTPTRSTATDPDCAALVVSNVGFDADNFHFSIQNTDPIEAYLQETDLLWPADGASGFDAFYMGPYAPERYYDPGAPVYTSPINATVDPERRLSDGMGSQTIQSIFHQLPEGDFQVTLTFGYWDSDSQCEVIVEGTHSPPSNDPVTFWMTSTSAFGGHKLVRSQPNGSARSGFAYLEFRTDPFAEATSIQSGQITVYFYATNSSDKPGQVGLILKPSSGVHAIGGGEKDIPANTTDPTLFSTTFRTYEYEFSVGNRLVLIFATGATTKIYWDGEWNATRIIVPPMSP